MATAPSAAVSNGAVASKVARAATTIGVRAKRGTRAPNWMRRFAPARGDAANSAWICSPMAGEKPLPARLLAYSIRGQSTPGCQVVQGKPAALQAATGSETRSHTTPTQNQTPYRGRILGPETKGFPLRRYRKGLSVA